MTNSRTITTMILILAFPILLCSIVIAPNLALTEASSSNTRNAVDVRESDGTSWNQLQQLNIFTQNNSVIAPSSSGSYSFTICNEANFPVDYELTVTDENLAQIPIVFRLKGSDGRYIVGDEDNWLNIDSLSIVNGSLDYKTDTSYVLEWMWPDTDRERNTKSGILAQEGVNYLLNLNILAQQSGPAIRDFELPVTGEFADGDHFALYASIICVLSILFIIMLLTKERKENESIS